MQKRTVIARVARVIIAGHSLTAHNGRDHVIASVGPRPVAGEDDHRRFACLSVGGGAKFYCFDGDADEAAKAFVLRVGAERANAAAKAAASDRVATLSARYRRPRRRAAVEGPS
jgi:hypothetical protein